jgi:hypothetical protein
MGSSKIKWTEAKLYGLLERKFSMPGYAIFRQVASHPTAPSRYADAVVMGLWKSHGFYLQGVEIKCSRSDVQVELRDPSKSDAIMRYCHRWWLLAAPGIVSPDELPETWGLLTVAKNGRGLTVAKKPTHLEPLAITPTFLASLLRRSAEQCVAMENRIEAEVARRMREANLISESDCDARTAREEERLRRLQDDVARFEAVFGASIRDRDVEGLGRIASGLRDLQPGGRFSGAWRRVQDITSRVDRIHQELKELQEVMGNFTPSTAEAANEQSDE